MKVDLELHAVATQELESDIQAELRKEDKSLAEIGVKDENPSGNDRGGNPEDSLQGLPKVS